MNGAPDGVVFRKPFDLRLDIDGTHFYEEHFDRIPYVFDDTIYLFKGDTFGVIVSTNSETPAVSYEPAGEKADVFFRFEQRTGDGAKRMMVLTIENRTDQTLTVEALMTVPGRKGVFYTRMLRVRPKMTNYEAWPHPIVQLVVRTLRLQRD